MKKINPRNVREGGKEIVKRMWKGGNKKRDQEWIRIKLENDRNGMETSTRNKSEESEKKIRE